MVHRLLPCLISLSALGQNVLHYTETSGFDHCMSTHNYAAATTSHQLDDLQR